MNLTGEKPQQKPPKPIRDKVHIAFVKAKPCLICGRRPSDAQHCRTGLRTMGKRVCDSKTVPLCRPHHTALHEMYGREELFWSACRIKPLPIAAQLWRERTGEWPEWYENDLG